MKNKFLISLSTFVIILILLSLKLNAESKVDVSKRPEALQEEKFDFPESISKKLSNGLNIFFIVDHEQPTVSMNLLIPGGSSMDGNKPGLAEFCASMLTKGTKIFKAEDISRIIDGLGATLSASANKDYISVNSSFLKKFSDSVIKVFADVLINPSFPKDELEKLLPIKISEIQQNKTNPSYLTSKLAARVIYGENHPYSQIENEKTIENISAKDIKEYYQKYFIPNISCLVIVGDVNPDEILRLLEIKLFGWKSGKLPNLDVAVTKPMPTGVYFIERPGSVQTTLSINAPAVERNSDNFEILNLTSHIIGAPFSGRLFRTVREKYSYTYTPFGNISRNKHANIISCGAEVRNSVTDSAMNVMLDQINSLTEKIPDNTEMNLAKKSLAGAFNMSFENSEFMSNVLFSVFINNISLEKYKTYTFRLMQRNAYDIMQAAQKYLRSDKLYFVVCGSPEVKAKLEKFGTIHSFNLDLETTDGEGSKLQKVSLDPEDLIKKNMKAIGGKDNIKKINTLITTGTVEMTMGGSKMSGKETKKQLASNKSFDKIDFGTSITQQWCDGKDLAVEVNAIMYPVPEHLKTKFVFESDMFYFLRFLEAGFKCEVLGKSNNQILMKVKDKKGDSTTYYYDAETFLITKRVSYEVDESNIPSETTEFFSDYAEFGGVKLPKTFVSKGKNVEVKSSYDYKINELIDEAVFKLPAK
ncbi:MAG: pitrilysin family protein [Candidatus Kapabacteria bacterium]|nr:pitrilysin family protein [Candidatus Kapabacteria bacterium]